MTVASVEHERELSFREVAHRCNPVRLYQLTQHCDRMPLASLEQRSVDGGGFSE